MKDNGRPAGSTQDVTRPTGTGRPKNVRLKYHGVVLLLSVATILTALLLCQPEAGHVRIGVKQIPELCLIRKASGRECPGCGLVRGTLFALHLDLQTSWKHHTAGIPLAAVLLLQIPYRLIRMRVRRETCWSEAEIRLGRKA